MYRFPFPFRFGCLILLASISIAAAAAPGIYLPVAPVGMKLWVSEDVVSFYDALEGCRNKGGVMYVPKSAIELNMLTYAVYDNVEPDVEQLNMLVKTVPRHHWIGVVSNGKNEYVNPITEETVELNGLFAEDEPSHDFGEVCIETTTSGLNDLSCTAHRHYVCQFNFNNFRSL